MRKWARRFWGTALCAVMMIAAAGGTLRTALPDTFSVQPGDSLSIACMPGLRLADSPHGLATLPAGGTQQTQSENGTLSIFGVLPVKNVRIVRQQRRTVRVCGTPFGIKMFANGALVVAFSDLYTQIGSENPAKEAGLRLGDLIVSANGAAVRTNDDLSSAIGRAQGQPIEICYLRGQEPHTCVLTPVEDRAEEVWKAGVWVRDSSAGIGTLTFADMEHMTFAGLGHAVSDTDTGTDLPLLSGEIVTVRITGCVPGAAGSPGELRGEFDGGTTIGTVRSNAAAGVYGSLTTPQSGLDYPVAFVQEVVPGEAQIYTTVDASGPRFYSVRIERVNLNAADPNRNMQIRIIDPELLKKTGGIVQGMSGSPILQSGRLVGAITHVLVNDPARGYGIFAENMLKACDATALRS